MRTMTTETQVDTTTVQLRFRLWSDDFSKPPFREVIDVLDGIEYLIESCVDQWDRNPAMENGGAPPPDYLHRPREGAILGERDAYTAASSSIRLAVLRVSYSSPFDIVLALSTLGSAVFSATYMANRVIGVYQKLSIARGHAEDARKKRADSRVSEVRAKMYEELADAVVTELEMRPLETDAKRVRNVIKAIQVIKKLEIEK